MNNSIGNLYKKGSTENTPKALDDIILKAAKQSCNPKSKLQKLGPWMMRLATAAVFVMGFSIIFNLQNVNHGMQVSPDYAENLSTTKIEFNQKSVVENELSQDLKGMSAKQYNQYKKNKPPKINLRELTKEEMHSNNQLSDQGTSSPAIPLPKAVPKLEYNRDSTETLVFPQISEKTTNIERKARKKQKNMPILGTTNPKKAPVPLQESPAILDGFSEKADNDEILTGSILTASEYNQNKAITLQHKLEQLQQLIREKKYSEAKKLLLQLKELYPDYDFTSHNPQDD